MLAAGYVLEARGFYSELDSFAGRYVTRNECEELKSRWYDLYKKIKAAHFSVKIPHYKDICSFEFAIENLQAKIDDLNEIFIKQELCETDSMLSHIDGKSLDEQQRRVVVTDEDRTLVLAGAGSGKTLTIAAKVKYLAERKKISPEKILLISFTNKSAGEMTERINKKLCIPVEAVTFHKLGLDVIKCARGKRPEVYDDAAGFIHDFFETDLLNRPDLVESLTRYFTYYIDIPENLDDCSSLGEYYEKQRNADLETLKSRYDRENFIRSTSHEKSQKHETLSGEKVKSIEETKIANFLFMHGIKYEYEKLYPFESEDSDYKAYRPDFYLSDYDIYLEHFGITRDYTCPWLSEVEQKKYIDGIKWKRDFHKKNGTRLIETYSYYTKEGCLLSELENLLVKNGVKFSPVDFNDVFKTVYASKSSKYFSEFIKLCCTFITLFKSNGFRKEHFAELHQAAEGQKSIFLRERSGLFLEIVEAVYDAYENHLLQNGYVDFSDMINDAAEIVKRGEYKPDYDYVIVDEYQDISRSRFMLLDSVVKSCSAKLLCVGDDWQSIYRFAGSDISLFTDFEENCGLSKTLKIEKTYRNSQQLIDEASRFVMKNPKQLKKTLRSDKRLDYPLVFWGYDHKPSDILKTVMQKIISEFGAEKSILLLGRTNYDIDVVRESGLFKIVNSNSVEKLIYKECPQTPVSFMSVHKSKGLEADNVVLLNFTNDKLGFPNEIADDVVLNMIMMRPEACLFAEERRLFYVAVTRTKNRTFVLTDNKNPSVFFREFSASKSCCFVQIKRVDEKKSARCPRCKLGTLYVIQNGRNKFIGCSNYPLCSYTLNDVTVLSNPKKCPECGGFLTKRKGRGGHWFIGCSNFPYCEHTERTYF